MVSVGDKVEVDQILLEIETDKATVEVPSEFSGIVKTVNIKDGDTAKVGDVLFTFDESGEEETGTGKDEEENVKEDTVKNVSEENKPEEKESKSKQPVPEESTNNILEFKLPELGENIESADITKILVSAGDKVEVDQVLLEIETDKATVEVPAEFSGIVKEVKFKEGDTAKVGDIILVVQTGDLKSIAPSEEKPSEKDKSETGIQQKDSKKEDVPSIKKTEERKSDPQQDKFVPLKKSFPSKIAPAAPSVRRFAREIGMDINEVSGTGPGGRISIDDVKRYSKSLNENMRTGGGLPVGIKRESLPDFSKWGIIRREPMSNVRKKTAEHLSYAWITIPHVTQFDRADITELEKLRKQFSGKAENAGGKLTVTAILMKIVASALKVFPQFNSSIDMDSKEIIFKEYFNIGIAVDTEKGLIVPVVRDVDKKNILELSSDLTEISNKARDKKVGIEDMQGACFTISNLGGIGGTAFTPIVNSPEVAILGVSRGKYEPVYKDGEFVPRLMLPLSLSYDHRIIDGADAARFIRWIAEALEQPFLLSLEG
jgi:pyruvate dehydrogenase E2 component (dihydrolipoamide acetyltransferase)